MLPLVLGTMMNPLNSTMLATALTTICHNFSQSISSGALLITPLYITSTIGQPLMGRMADIFSAKKINTLGFILVFIAAVIGMVAPNFYWLIVSRIVLGLGTSAAYPSAMAILNKKYADVGESVPGNLLGVVAVSSQVSMVLGPVLGGALTQWFGWKGIFFINIPWVLSALYFSRAIPDTPYQRDRKSNLFKRLDILGILLFSIFLLSLLFALMRHTLSVIHLAVLLVSLILLILWEIKQEVPFIPVGILIRQPSLFLVYIRTLATNYILYLILYALPQWIEGVKNIPPAQTGLLLFPMSLMSATMAMLSSGINRPFIQNGLGVVSIVTACFCLLGLRYSTPVWEIVGISLLMGVAVGINLIANQASLNAEAPKDQKGVSFGLYRTFGYLGAIISGSQLKTVFHNGVTDGSFHQLGKYAIVSCIIIVILFIPLWIKRENEKKYTAKIPPLD
jgi:MFS family permease